MLKILNNVLEINRTKTLIKLQEIQRNQNHDIVETSITTTFIMHIY